MDLVKAYTPSGLRVETFFMPWLLWTNVKIAVRLHLQELLWASADYEQLLYKCFTCFATMLKIYRLSSPGLALGSVLRMFDLVLALEQAATLREALSL